MQALLLSHRRKDVRDTAQYPPLMKAQASMHGQEMRLCTVHAAPGRDNAPGLHQDSNHWQLPHTAGLPTCCLQARTGKLKARALRHLAAEQLGLTIQEGEHSPVDDAWASLYLYLKHRKVGLDGWSGCCGCQLGSLLACMCSDVPPSNTSHPQLLALCCRSGSGGCSRAASRTSTPLWRR